MIRPYINTISRMDQARRRNSSVELFRILATIMVVIVHYNGWLAGGMPDHFDLSGVTFSTVSQAVIEGFTAVCVNCFLVITGFYGVKLKPKTFWNMWILLVSIYVPCEIVMQLHVGTFSPRPLIDDFIAFTRESYYVQDYLMLVFLSPVLNTFIDKNGKKILPYALVFWGIEIVFDWICHNQSLGFAQGYSLIHFILMYILGRTAFLYRNAIQNVGCIRLGGGYIALCLLISCIYIVGMKSEWSYAYSNPLNIAASFCLFFVFQKRSFYNKAINKIAASTFSVYILHTCAPLINVIRKIDVYTLANYSYTIYLLIALAVVCAAYLIGTLYDFARLALTKKLTDHMFEILCKRINLKFGYK